MITFPFASLRSTTGNSFARRGAGGLCLERASDTHSGPSERFTTHLALPLAPVPVAYVHPLGGIPLLRTPDPSASNTAAQTQAA